jgi:Tfp pilus assembly protein PilO
MPQDFTLRKRAILTALAVLLAADIGLGIYSYELAAAPHTPDQEFRTEEWKLKILKKDVDSAQSIRQDMPHTKADCEKFEHFLPPKSTGSSAMTADLDGLAKQAGLQIVTLAENQKELTTRGLTEVGIDLTVNGDYGSVARFVNGLQRSAKFYIVDGLTLSTESQAQGANGPLRVALHLRTYLREAA